MNKRIFTLEEYALKTEIPIDDLIGESRKLSLSVARFVYWFYLHKSDPAQWPTTKIAELFNRKYPAIINGIKQIQNFIDTKDPIIDQYKKEFIDPLIEPYHKK